MQTTCSIQLSDVQQRGGEFIVKLPYVTQSILISLSDFEKIKENDASACGSLLVYGSGYIRTDGVSIPQELQVLSEENEAFFG